MHSALETFVTMRYINLHLPYHTIPLDVEMQVVDFCQKHQRMPAICMNFSTVQRTARFYHRGQRAVLAKNTSWSQLKQLLKSGTCSCGVDR